MAQLKEGDLAPDFALPSDEGKMLSRAKLEGKPLVLYFYPKADTSGCTKEATEFNALLNEFHKMDCAVLAVSPDPVTALARFKKKYGLAFPLLGDESHATLESYGVWTQKSMYGRKYMGIERSAFLVGPDGTLEMVWYKVSPKATPTNLLEALASQKG